LDTNNAGGLMNPIQGPKRLQMNLSNARSPVM